MQQYLSNCNWFDTLVMMIIFVSTVFATFRGLIKAVLSLITWVSSGAISALVYPYSFGFLSTQIHNEKLAMAVSSLGVFLVVFIIIAIINSRIVYFLRRQTGGFFDRILGFCFGAARGVLIVCLIFFSISLTSKMLHIGKDPDRPGPDWFAKAQSYEVIDLVSNGLLTFAPDDMPQKLEQTVTKLKDMTLTTVGDELEASPNSTKTLSDDERKVMRQIISTLSQEDLAELYKKYDGNPANLSEFERVEVFKSIIAKYKDYVKDNKVPADKIVPEEQVKALEDSLNNNKAKSGTNAETGEPGYKDNNIKQLDRLIDGVK